MSIYTSAALYSPFIPKKDRFWDNEGSNSIFLSKPLCDCDTDYDYDCQ